MKISTRLISALLVSGLLATQTVSADCRDDITPSTPTSRFTINNNGTVTDNQTGLMWMRCSLGQMWDGTTCTGDAATYPWAEALATADDYNFADFTDWYLPNVKELTSIVETACHSPAINQTVFPNALNSSYWSSSPYAYYYGYSAWYVNFNDGYGSSYKKGNVHVRLVRAGVAQ